MTRSRTSPLFVLFAGWLTLSGCAAGPDHSTRTFEPGAHSNSRANVRVELREAVYGPRDLTVEVVVTNLGTEPLTIRREGLLLAQDDLELPAQVQAESPIAEALQVPAGGSLALRIPFASVAPSEAVLRLRALARGDAPVDVIDVEVPGPPSPEET